MSSKCTWSLAETSGGGAGDAHEMWKSCSLVMGRCCNHGSNFQKVPLVPLFPLSSPLGGGGKKKQAAVRNIAIINSDP